MVRNKRVHVTGTCARKYPVLLMIHGSSRLLPRMVGTRAGDGLEMGYNTAIIIGVQRSELSSTMHRTYCASGSGRRQMWEVERKWRKGPHKGPGRMDPVQRARNTHCHRAGAIYTAKRE